MKITTVRWHQEQERLMALRTLVFVQEQGVPAELEEDYYDPYCLHVMAGVSNQVIGCGRLLPDGHIGRMAVREDFRGKGVGQAILKRLLHLARIRGHQNVILHAQAQAMGFYQKAGFQVTSEPFEEAGIEHVQMMLQQPPMDMMERLRELEVGLIDAEIAINSRDMALQAVMSLAQQAKLQIRLFSPNLESALYDQEKVIKHLSNLARRNPHTSIQILVSDSHNAVKNGHRLLQLAQRLSSSIEIRRPIRQHQALNQSMLLADALGYVFLEQPERFVGRCNFYDSITVKALSDVFREAWNHSTPDPEIRNLMI